ncbi:aminotransferase class III-fold pyridoxal phosphate-dependent enzyme [Rhizorhabdus wittichii]|uniref:aminotransferase class III-fold pyridoxal phosphate-dependent enzyme n=1 Tax=Rhizorhabdus wittichii TaxID=160791 RepID=UPI001D00BEEC|nr:aminotransferase class III-fold pyridoxal phosphate-dependent enzyme [Rhizorhabdus wittichii]
MRVHLKTKTRGRAFYHRASPRCVGCQTDDGADQPMTMIMDAQPGQGTGEATGTKDIFDAYIERSWRSNAQRQRDRGIEFIIGEREGPHIWTLEGDRRIVDCGPAGGVHSLGHRHPAVLGALRKALDDGRDTGLWSVPNAEYLAFQDLLTELAPRPELNRSVVTLASTVSIDLAIMFAFRFTGRRRILVYRHGYHGHTGLAALSTGSLDEGVLDYYNLPTEHTAYFERYGDMDAIDAVLDDSIAAVILEPMDYETFAPAENAYLSALEAACRRSGALLVIDETRTGLGRSGKVWATSHFDVRPDIMVTGKGLSGGLYPVSALLMRQEIYDRCMNEHKFAYISSLGGNEISCVVAAEVLRQSSRPELLANVARASTKLREAFEALARRHSNLVGMGTVFGCIATLEVRDPAHARPLYKKVFEQGVLCHSVSVIEPTVLKFFPSLIIDDQIVAEIAASVDRALSDLRDSL